MKRHLLTLLALALTLGAWSAPITQWQALNEANRFFTAHGITVSSRAKAFRSPQKAGSETAAYYVVNADDSHGFVIVSGDDRTEPILGYSLSGSITEDDMSDNMRSWLQSYQEQIEYIQKNNITVRKATDSNDRAVIEPMLTTKWNQLEPYNNLCPKVGGSYESATGCVATAMAQTLYFNYLQHPETITKTITADINAYTCQTRWNGVMTRVAAVPAGTTIDWANMLPEYTDDATETQQTAVAQLMAWCGASVNMNYGPASNGGSSASSSQIAKALINNFGFDASTKLVNRDDGFTTRQWNDLVYNELANRRVVIYTGVSSAGSGHAFVINGYEGNNFFDVNWGWGGSGDGAYLLSILDPVGTGTGAGQVASGFNLKQDIIINAEPDHGGEAALRADAYDFKQDGNTLSFTLRNLGTKTANFDYAFGILASDGSITITGTSQTTPGALRQNAYYPTVLATLDLSTLPDGTYDIVPVGKLTTEDTWHNLWTGRTINVTVSDGNVTFNGNGTASLKASELTVGTARKAGRPVSITTTLTNDGNADYEGLLYIFASLTTSKGDATLSQQASVMAGSTAEFTTQWTPTGAGTYTIWLCSDADGDDVLATVSGVEIEEGNGQYDLSLTKMTVNGEDAASQTTDSDGRIVTNVKGNSISGTYTIKANKNVSGSAITYLYKYDEQTEDYTQEIRPTSYYPNISQSAGGTLTLEFHFTDLADGRYLVKPYFGTIDNYGNVVEVQWFDDSHVYVIDTATGIASTTASKTTMVTVYNLQGMKVATLGSDKLGTLPRGLYIINGRKVSVGGASAK